MIAKVKGARLALAVPLLAITAACGSGSSADNQSAVNTLEPMTNGAQAVPSGPFAQAEMQAHERMMAATGANASETWVRKMIEHHRGAAAMSQVLINSGGDSEFVRMARMDVAKQTREIAELEQMLSGGITGGSGEANPFGAAERAMHQQMVAATGSNLSQVWARKMMAHHQGAVDMSQVLIRQGGHPEVVAMARRVAADQAREIGHLEAMLRGEGMPSASPAAAAPPPASARPAPVTAVKESQRSAPARAAQAPAAVPKATPVPRPAPAPEASPPPQATCAPEHRAAGHC